MSDITKALETKITGGEGKSAGNSSGTGPTTILRKTTEIVPERWNELHSYSFSVNGANKDGSCKEQQIKSFPLVLAPQSIGISTPFAISAIATNKGILEENNGVVFRNISISGTTGLYPLRDVSKGSSSNLSGTFKSFAPKTAKAIDSVLKKIATAAASGGDVSSSNINLQQTGYYQFWALNNFLVEYAESKKTKNGKNIRLVFNCPKDNISYVCTPISFNLSRSAADPLLYYYSIQLKCWDVTTSKGSLDNAFDDIPSKDNLGAVKKVLDRLRESRDVMQSASNVLKSVQSDINDVMNVYSQGVLRIKDVVGTAREIKDMPDIIKNNAHNMFKNNQVPWRDITQDKINTKKITNPTNPFVTDKSGRSSGKGFDLTQDTYSGISSTGLSALNGSGSRVNPDGSTPSSVHEEQNAEAIQIIYKITDNPLLSEGITIEQLGKLSRSMELQIEKRIAEANSLTSGDIRRHADKLKEISDNLAYSSGTMHPSYAKVYGLRIPTEDEARTPSEEDILLGVAIEEARDAYLTTLASGDIYGQTEPDPFAAAEVYLEQKIVTPTSAFPVSVNRGYTLEDIAIQYLGDATRSREIVLLNDLSSPYIDEVGFDQKIKNCSGRTFIVNNVEKLAITQSIRIVGTLMPTTRRQIINIDDIGGGNYKITVDGSPDLNQYDASKYPKLYARLPGTVGSGDILLMPSDLPADEQTVLKSTPLTERLSYAEKVFKVDLALHPETSDFIVSSSGDIARSYGYNNAIQAIKLIIETERQQLFLHPDYGINLNIGNVITSEVYKEITERIRAAIVKDPRFNNASVAISKEGTAVKIKVEVIGSNGTGRIPLEFQLSE